MSSRRTGRRPSHGRSIGLIALALVLLAPSAHASAELELIPKLPLLVPLLLIFVALVFPVNALIMRPIFRALDERQSRIAGARHRAEQIQQEAQRVLERYEESIRRARTEAEATRKQHLSEARGEHLSITRATRLEAEAKIERARGDLARALEEARTGLRAGSRELARAAAERILGRTLS